MLGVRNKARQQRDLQSHPYAVNQAHALQEMEQAIDKPRPHDAGLDPHGAAASGLVTKSCLGR